MTQELMTYPEPFRYDIVDVRYVEDGKVHQTVINSWNPQLHSSEVLLWNKEFKIGIIRKKLFSTKVLTNFRIMELDENNRILTSFLMSSVDDVFVMNTRRESESMGYGFFGGRYAAMAGPFFSSGTSKTVGSIVFVINGHNVEWVEIPDPTGLKNFVKAIIKTMYAPLTKLDSKRTRAGACPQCGFQNVRNAQFCNGCGTQLLQECSNCQQLNPIDATFCNKCGSEIGVNITISADTPSLSNKVVSEKVKTSYNECKSIENNIKINYPSTWTKTFDNSKPPVRAIIFMPPKGDPANLVITVDDSVGNITFDAYNENFISAMRKGLPDFKLSESTPSTLSGLAAHQLTFSERKTKRLIVSTIKNNVLYSIMYVADHDVYFRHLSAAKQMISSFEIVN